MKHMQIGLLFVVAIATSNLQIGQTTGNVVERFRKLERRSASGGVKVKGNIKGGGGGGLNGNFGSGGNGGFLGGLLDSGAEGHGLCGGNGPIFGLLNSGGEGGFLGGFLNSGGDGNGLCGGLLNSGGDGGFLGGLLDSGADGNGLCGGKGPIAGFLNSGGEGGFLGGFLDSGANGKGLCGGKGPIFGLLNSGGEGGFLGGFLDSGGDGNGLCGGKGPIAGFLNSGGEGGFLGGFLDSGGNGNGLCGGLLNSGGEGGFLGGFLDSGADGNGLCGGKGPIAGFLNSGGEGGFLGSIFADSTGGGDGDGSITFSPDSIIQIPIAFIQAVSGAAGGIASGILNTVSSPITLSGEIGEAGFEQSPIIGPICGTLYDGIEAVLNSPTTISSSLSDGMEDIIEGIFGVIISPLVLSSEAVSGGFDGIIDSPFEVLPALCGNVAEAASGVLRVVSSPLTLSAGVLDFGVDLTVNSAGGALLPEASAVSLPDSISRGIEALIESPLYLSDTFYDGFELIADGILGILFSPFILSSAIYNGDLTLHMTSPLIFPEEFNSDLGQLIGGAIASPFYAMHSLSAQLGITVAGVLTTVSSPVSVSGELIDETLNADAASGGISPEESNFGLPTSIAQGAYALMGSPIAISSTISDSSHLLFDGLLGIFTSPITTISGYSPFPIPGSENYGPLGIIDSPFDLAEALSGNVGYTLSGILGLVSSPVTLSAQLLRVAFNINAESLFVLPEQLELFGVPDSIGSTIASFLEVPFEGLLSLIGFLSSPLALVDGIGIANVPGSPSSPKIYPEDFPIDIPNDLQPDYVPTTMCVPALSASVFNNGDGDAVDISGEGTTGLSSTILNTWSGLNGEISAGGLSGGSGGGTSSLIPGVSTIKGLSGGD